MRKTLTLAVLTTVITTATAQNSNVVSAFNYLQDGNFAKAVEYIEPAIANEATMVKEKTWRYRGDIYRSIALGDDQALKNQFPDALNKAIESYLKARELDTKHEWDRENIQALGALQVASLNMGNDAYTAKDYDLAVACYENSQRIAASAGQVDSLACFNKALALETKGDLPKAVAAYRECLDMGYQKLELYRSIGALESKQKNHEAAIKAANDGLVVYPGNKLLLEDLLSYLLDAGRENEVEPVLLKALEKDPCNPVFLSILATGYEKRANPPGGTPPADATDWVNKAETAYKKAIECDPDFFDAHYNIGVLYNNRAAVCYDKANAIQDNAKYNKAKAECDAIYDQALPYFEKAHQLRPEDQPTIQQLMKFYGRKNDQAKYDALKAELEKLKGK